LLEFKKKCVVLLATGCYAGYIPIAPGTLGTLVAVPLCYVLFRMGPLEQVLFIAGFAGLAVWVAGEGEKIFERKDPALIVIDEMAGFMVTLLLIPWSTKNVVIGFFLFRLMDIAKPFPIRRLESKWPRGWGIVGDDVLAGVYANVLLRLATRLF
jgi:phosphatidylglycerophosphatase A